MQQLIWCFFSVSGRLSRLPFLLAMAVLLLLSIALQHIVEKAMFGDIEPELAHSLVAASIVALVLFWPSVALQIKRLRDAGYNYKIFIGIIIAIVVASFLLPAFALVMNAAFLLFLLFAPTRAGDYGAR